MAEPVSHDTDLESRSYELDGFGHLNHAVFLNHFEFARFQALAAAGFPAEVLLAGGVGIHVVRIEVDYVKEVVLGQRIRIRTWAESARHSSLELRQLSFDPADPETVFARARVVVVWIGSDRRPARIPEEVRRALGVGGNTSP